MLRTEDQNLAEPAPRVEAATVSRVQRVEPAVAPPQVAVEPATVDPCASVEPATTYHRPATNTATSNLAALTTQQLRGATGADFESSAAVLKGAVEKNFLQVFLPCIYDERDFVAYGEVKYYVLVKDGLCYVYVQETDPSPLYAIELELYTAMEEDPAKPAKTSWTISPLPNTNLPRPTMKTVLLYHKRTGRQAFQFTFDTEHQPGLHKLFLGLFDEVKKTTTTNKQPKM